MPSPPEQKCALIVDDSPTAREFLSRMLEQYQLRVDTAGSAEAALEYLTHHRPDVIFMDHMMPGMDGFEAVRSIKANPATAIIPVMMYTSQSGELYVGQARALGAVGVLPKQIKPVEVAEVLRSLHLFPGDPKPPAVRAVEQADEPEMAAVMRPGDWSELHRWLQEMLADHSRSLRSDLEASVTRVLGEHLAREPAAPPASRRFPWWPTGAVMVTLAGVAAVFFWLHLDAQERWQAAVRQNQNLMAALEARRSSDVEQINRALAVPASRMAGPQEELLSAIEWSINQAAAYPPNELPFGDRRLDSLDGLLEQLRAVGFVGSVRLESHVGEFCMMRGDGSGYEPAPADLPATDCERVGLPPDEARTMAERQSVTFANYLAELALRPDIHVEIEPMGNGRPRENYPASREGVNAGEWNRIAAVNNRVEVRLLPETMTASAGAAD